MTNKPVWAGLLLGICTLGFAQSNNQTSSPYSLFGIGRLNEVNTGITNALGKSGVALSGESSINNLNPAAVADVAVSSFLFDIGAKGEQNSYTNKLNGQVNTTFNFSSVAFATAINKRSGIGVSLSPYSDVGYTLIGRANSIEGSQQTYTSYINGSGGLNAITLNYGYKLSPKLNLGVSAIRYFGKMDQNEQIALEDDYLSVTATSHYSGYRFSAGGQYKVNDKLSLGAVITAPSYLGGKQERTVQKRIDDIDYTETGATNDIAGFKLPMETTIGLRYTYKDYTLNADYKRQFWSATGMGDNIGTFVDCSVLGIGAQYVNVTSLRPSYLQRFQYRVGATADNGYLNVDGVRVKNLALTTGIGVPLGSRKSFLNISYSYGQRGAVSTKLIQENYHAFTVNISLEDLWFVRRKFE
ncbi:MAG: hypothetical protein ACLGH8_12630 [Bacteroidia bacterium]